MQWFFYYILLGCFTFYVYYLLFLYEIVCDCVLSFPAMFTTRLSASSLDLPSLECLKNDATTISVIYWEERNGCWTTSWISWTAILPSSWEPFRVYLLPHPSGTQSLRLSFSIVQRLRYQVPWLFTHWHWAPTVSNVMVFYWYCLHKWGKSFKILPASEVHSHQGVGY